MKLAVFDIDGTLTQTNGIDARCFSRAFEQDLGIRDLDADWSSYPHRTDSGIAAEICRRHLGRSISASEERTVQHRFLRLLEEAAASEPGEFQPVPGARRFLASLPSAGWAVALATGGWRSSAELKLESSGLDLGLPLATSSEAVPRQEIVANAITSAERFYRVDRFERIVSVGDGDWDLQVARELDLPFVGITVESNARELLALGASHVLTDFSRPKSAMNALNEAIVPSSSSSSSSSRNDAVLPPSS